MDHRSSKQYIEDEDGRNFADATHLTEHVDSADRNMVNNVARLWAAKVHKLKYFVIPTQHGKKTGGNGKKKVLSIAKKKGILAACVGNKKVGQLKFHWKEAVIIQEASTGSGVPETSTSRLER